MGKHASYGLYAGFGLFVLVMMVGGKPGHFLDFYSFWVVPGAAIFFTVTAHGGEFWRALQAGFLNRPLDVDAGLRHLKALGSFRSTLVGTGIVATLLGWVHMLRAFETLTEQNFGPAGAVSLLTIMYAVFISELLVVPADSTRNPH